MNFINNIIERAKKDKKTIILPESMDDRVLEAAKIIEKEGIANVILIGNEESLRSLGFSDNIKIIDPNKNINDTLMLANKLYELRKEKGMTFEQAQKLLLEDNMYYACMLVKERMADGIVSGACHSSADTLRPALQIIKGKNIVSAFFLMDVPNTDYGLNGTFIFADCGLIQNPTAIELSEIAHASAQSFEYLTKCKAYVAMISHSTKGSAKHELVDKVVEATNIAKKNYPDLNIDGELQVDAAIDSDVAKMKCTNSSVAGHANVLIFPNLDAGNSAYKLVQKLAHADAFGPITQGLNKPVNDLSRGCSVNDIVGAVAITAVQAQNISDKN